jgi:four helix bundle protein
MQKSSFRNLIAWRKAMTLCVTAYELTELLPKREEFSLTAQIRRAAISVPSNIAEGRGRGTARDYRRFLMHARGSLFELQTQLLIAAKLRYVSWRAANRFVDQASEVACVVNGLIRSLTSRAPTRYSRIATR